MYNTLSRFAVPCFFMLSGAFLLEDDRNEAYRFFYKKSLKSVGIPTFIFSILYFLYGEAVACASILVRNREITRVLSPIKGLLKGAPGYHLWYLYTLLGIYFVIPVLLKVKKSMDENTFFKLSVIMLVLGTISGWTSSFQLHWSIAKSVCYLGYLLMGYQLRKYNKERKNNKLGMLHIGLAFLTELILTAIQYQHSLQGITEADERYIVIGNFAPLVVIASLFLFSGFSKLSIKWNLSKLSAQTFHIYLFHAGVLSIIQIIMKKFVYRIWDIRIIIPIEILLTFVFSYLLSVLYTKLWKEIEKRYFVTAKVCKWLKLEV